ncbi:unnamed protein product [Spirodela intermedia]|uniref:Uncharacterized protein n=1 Tax=Spirodela intermedia TaxID=51605 RepID=A0A7I8JEF5_SPIIN|nr:unnamed protein product [Spirodela intermedia]CAA6668538.1 unnamed protein product [Spirodela intermedia]
MWASPLKLLETDFISTHIVTIIHLKFSLSKSDFITFQDQIDQKFDDFNETLKQLLTRMSTLESHSCPPRDHEIRHPQKVTHVESSSHTHYTSCSTNFCMKIDLSYFNESFFKLNDIIMVVEHIEVLLEKRKPDSKFWKPKFNSSTR